MIECVICGTNYKPEATRWLCPGCGWKDTCCDGEPCPLPDVGSVEAGRSPLDASSDVSRETLGDP